MDMVLKNGLMEQYMSNYILNYSKVKKHNLIIILLKYVRGQYYIGLKQGEGCFKWY